MARFSEALLDQIRQRADLVQIVQERVSLQQKGRDWTGCCPFHEEKTPSFYVNPAKQAWFCHGSCKRGGDVFTFVQEIEKVKFPEAVRLLAQRTGVVVEEETPEERAKSQRRAELLETLRRAVDFYHQYLLQKANDPIVRIARELLAKRGVKDETVRAWKIGVAPAGSALLKVATKKSPSSVRALRELGLVHDGARGTRDFFHERLLFPISDESGRPIGFGGRKLREEDNPKFLNSRELPGFFEKKRVLYGLDRARETRPAPEQLVVVEGYLDAVICHQEGATNVVAALSTEFTREHATLAKRFAKGVVILWDGDKAGAASSRRVLERLIELDLNARVGTLPEGLDPDEFILKEGKASLEKIVREQSREPFDYLLDTSLASAEGGRATGELVGECARLLGLFPDGPRRDLAIRRVFERLAIPEDRLRLEVSKAEKLAARTARPATPGDRAAAEQNRIVVENADRDVVEMLGPHACAGESFEVHLLEALLARPDLARGRASDVRADDFTRGPLREVASSVLRTARDETLGLAPSVDGAGGDAVFVGRVLQATAAAGPAVEGVVTRLLARIHEHPNKAYDAELEGVGFLLRRRARQRLEALTREVAEANARGDWDAVERLLREKTSLERDSRRTEREAAAAPVASAVPEPHPGELRPGAN